MCRTTMSHTHTVPFGLVLANIPLLILHAPICLQCALLRQARQADSDGKLAATSIGAYHRLHRVPRKTLWACCYAVAVSVLLRQPLRVRRLLTRQHNAGRRAHVS